MSGFVESILKRVGLLPEVSDDEMINASIENAFYDHKKEVDVLMEETAARRAGNDRLRNALQIAKMRATTLGEFENAIRGERRGNGNAS